MNHLLFFIGTDCPHCEIMKQLLDRLEHDLGISVITHDVWKDEQSYRILKNYTKGHDCDGIPVFINTQTNVILCGEISYKQLKSWAMGGNVIQ